MPVFWINFIFKHSHYHYILATLAFLVFLNTVFIHFVLWCSVWEALIFCFLMFLFLSLPLLSCGHLHEPLSEHPVGGSAPKLEQFVAHIRPSNEAVNVMKFWSKSQQAWFVVIDKFILKFIWKCKESRLATTILWTKKYVENLHYFIASAHSWMRCLNSIIVRMDIYRSEKNIRYRNDSHLCASWSKLKHLVIKRHN